jgi:ligand-binding sensor protein
MFSTDVQPQPISVSLDMAQIEGYDETKKVIKAFNIETKTVSEKIDDVEFSTRKNYDKKYIFDCSSVDAVIKEKLKLVIAGTLTGVVIVGEVVSNTDATLSAHITSVEDYRG